MKPRRMAAVVLNHRTIEDTCLAVSSLLASNRRPDLVIVVDNDVADQGRARFTQHGDQSLEPRTPSLDVTYLHTGRNLGFSGGMNVGIRASLDAGADLVLLVNSDIVVSPDCLERLESALLDQPRGGVAGPLVLSRARPDRVDSAGIRYNERTGRMRVLDEGAKAAEATPNTRVADAVSGCLMLVTREVCEAIGLLDERYFFSFEELDFCLRARQAGLFTLVVGSAVAYHKGRGTIGQASPRRFYFGTRNHLLLASRRGQNEGHGARACRLSWVAVLSVAHAITAESGSLPARLIATARGVRDYLRGRYGADPDGK